MSVAGYVWLGLVVVTIIIEFLTLELVSIWVSLGSLVGLILELCGVPLEWQIVVAVVVTIVCILGLRRFCVKFLLKSKEKTNMDIYIGAKEKLVTKIDGGGLGSICINGVTWSAKSENGESIKEGSLVEILRLEGNRFVFELLHVVTSGNVFCVATHGFGSAGLVIVDLQYQLCHLTASSKVIVPLIFLTSLTQTPRNLSISCGLIPYLAATTFCMIASSTAILKSNLPCLLSLSRTISFSVELR